MVVTPAKIYTRLAITIVVAAVVISASIFSYSAIEATVTKSVTGTETTTSTQFDTMTVTATEISTDTVTSIIQDSPSTTTTISPSGLGLQAELNATTIYFGGTVSARLTLSNTLDQNLSLVPDYAANSTIKSWNGYDFFCGSPIFSGMIGYALFKGYYTADNFSLSESPLQLSPPVELSCVSYPTPASIVLLPESDIAVVYPPNEGNPNQEQVNIVASTESCSVNSAGAYLCGLGSGFSGYWNSTSPITSQDAMIGSKYWNYLPVGECTLAVQDMWNQTVYAQFTVIPRSATTTSIGSITGTVTTQPQLYNVTFQQIGACSPSVYTVPWSVTLGGQTRAEPPNTPLPIPGGGYSAGPEPPNLYTIVFTSVPDGVYPYKIAPSGPFTITSGTVTVNGSNVSVPVDGPVVSCSTTATG